MLIQLKPQSPQPRRFNYEAIGGCRSVWVIVYSQYVLTACVYVFRLFIAQMKSSTGP